MTARHEQAAVLALVSVTEGDWSRISNLVTEAGSAIGLVEQRTLPLTEADRELAAVLTARLDTDTIDRARTLIEQTEARGARLVTVLDDDYPLNLHQVFNRPPFLWVRGALSATDDRALAVVGTRAATERGLAIAATFSRAFVDAGYAVVSGLAAGIDTQAHRTALDAGGRTLAVVGTGILRPTYPAGNAQLDEEIARRGAVVSQFWPDAPGRRTTFPLRNVVTSGLALGTLVVEASTTSGAKMQARLALEHGKRLFLLDSLVDSQDWARRYAARPGVVVVSSPDEVIGTVAALTDQAHQASLTF